MAPRKRSNLHQKLINSATVKAIAACAALENWQTATPADRAFWHGTASDEVARMVDDIVQARKYRPRFVESS